MTTATVERPILFSGPMVRAILDGKKTQTRRVVKLDAELLGRGCTSLEGAWMDPGFGDGQRLKVLGPYDTAHRLYSPYGHKGERLWVRETWRCFGGQEYEYQRDQKSIVYKATAELIDSGPWKPSIFMPRWACRLELEITGVRVERLQKITEDDAKAEGVEPSTREDLLAGRFPGQPYSAAYALLWEYLNAKRGFGWESNPWVWVLEFRRAQK